MPEAWFGTTSWIIAVIATSEDFDLLTSQPIKPADGGDRVLFCAVASMVSAAHSRITGNNEMYSVFIINFLSLKGSFWKNLNFGEQISLRKDCVVRRRSQKTCAESRKLIK